ncbi:MAG: bifunctional acetate--CoA ligase family protein/GNAT family N-acetyltransferase [Mesorhizobium sp.]|nr:bifunctional acetate--CoA ligase family protein/GNAT family N-acetyltransferase [Mesorhizobium sp.]
MTIRNLQFAIHPTSVAVIGASNREGSVGRVVLDNIVKGGFEGPIWPVNPKYRKVGDLACYARAADLPGVPDLAVIVTPPETVPGIIRELGEKGARAAVVITAGLTRENGLRQKMLDAAKPFLFRIIGPNTLGLMVPPAKLNAGFAHMAAKPGGIALLSQSGAIATSLIDWAADNNLGFSHIVSLGDMADVDVGDYLDMLAGDAKTRAIVMYLESIPNPRKFMSAARAAARIKPVIAIKSGRHEQAAKAAATHTGALSGADRVADAALRRAGILRVNGLAELFDAAETTARFASLDRSRVGIVTNGGGAGVLAVDQLIDCGGELAELTAETIALLDKSLPATWSRANPVDIIGDAPAARYAAAVEAVAADPGTDAILVLNCPTGLASPTEAAGALAALATNGTINGKPVLACWLGEHTARAGRHLLQQAGVASYETPAAAATAVSYLSDWSRAQKALMRVPTASGETIDGARDAVLAIFRLAAAEGRRMLTEPEAKAAIGAYGIPVPVTVVAATPAAAEKAAQRLLEHSEKVVVKLLSKTLTHKSDVGGVVLGIETAKAAREAAEAIRKRVAKIAPTADIEGYAVQPMVVRSRAQELIIGVSRDPIFGPVILFGAGGIAVEVTDDTAIGLPPLDDVLAGDLIERTRIGRLLAGFRDRKPADRAAITQALNAMSQMIVDFPCIVAMDINPLLADSDGVIALDARIEIDPKDVERPGPNPDLAIRPYPSGWERDVTTGAFAFHIRPIRPADVTLYPDFLAKISPHDLRLRFLAPMKQFSESMLMRLTQLDYDRDMAFVALTAEGELAGIGRLSSDPDRAVAEFGLLIRTDLQGHGLGWTLLKLIIDYAKSDGIGRIDGFVLDDNTKMLAMCREFGFSVRHHEPGVSVTSLELGTGPANRS